MWEHGIWSYLNLNKKKISRIRKENYTGPLGLIKTPENTIVGHGVREMKYNNSGEDSSCVGGVTLSVLIYSGNIEI